MSTINVQIADEGTIKKAAALLQGIDGGLEKAVRSAAGRATQHLRTNASKMVRQQYAIKAREVSSANNAKVSYTYNKGVTATVTFGGSVIPLIKFDGSGPAQPAYDNSRKVAVLTGNGWKKVHPGTPARGHAMKGTAPVKFEHAFVARFGSGHVGIYSRTGGATRSGRDELSEIMSLSVPQMLSNEDVEKELSDQAMTKFNERLDHEITAILNGWR